MLATENWLDSAQAEQGWKEGDERVKPQNNFEPAQMSVGQRDSVGRNPLSPPVSIKYDFRYIF